MFDHTELAKLKNTPTDDELNSHVEETKAAVQKTLKYLEPLRSGAPLISPEEMEKLDKDWSKWRSEWVNRKKVFTTLVSHSAYKSKQLVNSYNLLPLL